MKKYTYTFPKHDIESVETFDTFDEAWKEGHKMKEKLNGVGWVNVEIVQLN